MVYFKNLVKKSLYLFKVFNIKLVVQDANYLKILF